MTSGVTQARRPTDTPSPRVPIIHTDEPVFGYANRAFILSGYESRDVFYRRLLGNGVSGISSLGVESGLSKFQKSMQHFGVRFGRTVPEEHCVGVLGLPFCSDAISEKKVRSVTEHRYVGRWLYFGMAKTKIKPSPSHCPACTAGDIENIGYAHWRRAPQIVGVRCCTTHKIALCDRCPSCDYVWSTFDFPSSTCPSCETHILHIPHLTKDVVGAVQYRFAEAVEGVFAGRITGPMTSERIRSRIFDVLPGPNKVLGNALSRLFTETASAEYLQELGLSYGDTDKMPWPTYLYARRAIIAEATVQLLTYAVLSWDKTREDMFCAAFPNERDWRVVDTPSDLIGRDWYRGYVSDDFIGYRQKNLFN